MKQHRIAVYAVERSDTQCLQILIDYELRVRINVCGGIPLLAYAIMRSKWTLRNTTDLVKLFPTHGADHRRIPQDM